MSFLVQYRRKIEFGLKKIEFFLVFWDSHTFLHTNTRKAREGSSKTIFLIYLLKFLIDFHEISNVFEIRTCNFNDPCRVFRILVCETPIHSSILKVSTLKMQ